MRQVAALTFVVLLVIACNTPKAASMAPDASYADVAPGLESLAPAVESFGAWDKSGAPPRTTDDGGCDPMCQHDQAVRDMERLMNSGF